MDEHDYHKMFTIMAGHVRIVAEAMLRECFGERCDDFKEHCPICQRWKALDVLLDDPWGNSKNVLQ